MNGEKGPTLVHAINARLCELLPRARHRVIPATSHIVHEDNPATFDATLGFLGETYPDAQA